MRAGRMRHRATWQRRTMTATTGGSFTETWSTQATVWVQIEPLSGGENRPGDSAIEVITYRVSMRYPRSDPPLARDRLVWDSKTFNIDAVSNPDGMKRECVLICKVGTDEVSGT